MCVQVFVIMSSKRYNISNHYNGLEEAINSILEDNDSDADYEYAIIPPEPSVVSDEENGAKEDMVTASLPREVPSNIEVFMNDQNTISSDGNVSSDDEPLAKKAKRSRPPPEQLVQRKCLPTYCSTALDTTDVPDRQMVVKEQLESLTPVQIFDEEVIR